jgi:phospholipid/cholesterol/gamma-HCH transport system ATP-binding protein
LSRLAGDEPQLIFDGSPDEMATCDDPRVRQFVLGEARDRLMEMREAGAVDDS